MKGHALRSHMHTWAFINNAAWCYMNSCIWGVMWSMTFLHNPVEAWGALQGVANLAKLGSGRPIKLTQCPAVRNALREWHTLHPGGAQQDGAEFCTVVIAGLVGFCWGSYQARCQFEPPENHALHQPLLLQLPSGRKTVQPVTLQALVTEWHEACGKLQALAAGHAMICLQIERCSALHVKNRLPVSVPSCRTLLFPVFCAEQRHLQVHWQEYTIRAMVIHRGERPSHGHFHTVLFDDSQAWLADDGSGPRPYKVVRDDERDLYLIWLTKSQHVPGECSVRPEVISPVTCSPNGDSNIQQVLARFF